MGIIDKETRFQTAYGPHRKSTIEFKEENSMTKQHHQDECDINKIMERFQVTKTFDHFSKFGEQYADIKPLDLHNALNITTKANTMFEELPSHIRNKFENEPKQFLKFIQNKENLQEARDLGLAKRATEPIKTKKQSSDLKNETESNLTVSDSDAKASGGEEKQDSIKLEESK